MSKKILFFCPLPNPITGQSLVSKMVYDTVKPFYLINYSITISKKIIGTFWVILNIIFTVVFNKIDVLYFTCTRSKFGAIKDIILITLCKWKKVKIINHVHGNDLPQLFEKSVLQKIIFGAYNKIDTTIVLFEGQKKQLEMFKKMQLEVVENCYDPILDNLEGELANKSKSKVHVLYLSNLMATKGVFLFLDAIDTLAPHNSQLYFHIAGQPMGDSLMKAEEAKLNFDKKYADLRIKYGDRVLYHGSVSGYEKVNLLVKCDIFVLPTFYETEAFPISILEAMRAGNAVVTTNHNFLPELISEKEGRLVEKKNQISLNESILFLVENSDLRAEIQKHNILTAKEKYSPLIFKSKMKNILSTY